MPIVQILIITQIIIWGHDTSHSNLLNDARMGLEKGKNMYFRKHKKCFCKRDIFANSKILKPF